LWQPNSVNEIGTLLVYCFILFRFVFRLRVSRNKFLTRTGNLNPFVSTVGYSVLRTCYFFSLQETGEIVFILTHLFLIMIQAARFITQKRIFSLASEHLKRIQDFRLTLGSLHAYPVQDNIKITY
jgi:hypothetical protein